MSTPEAATAAVVVSYGGGSVLATTVSHLVDQVRLVVIVDNGSTDPATLSVLRELEGDGGSKVAVLRNDSNRGIAAALNRGTAYAIDRGYCWVLTMDHDSEAHPDMVARLLETISADGQIAIAAPLSVPEGADFGEPGRPQSLEELEFIHTSGNLVRADVWRALGGFREDYFIDYVDYEFCWRARKAGYRIVRVPEARLRHRFAYKSSASFFGRRVTCTNYSPRRRYYQMRNGITLARTMADWRFAAALANSLGRDTLKVLLFETEKQDKFLAMARGIRDGLQGKLGPAD